MFGDIVKVTPSSKVVGDMALMMVTSGLARNDVENASTDIAFPESVVSFFKGDLGQPYGGFPPALQAKILAGVTPLSKRPGAVLPPVDLAAERLVAERKAERTISDAEFASYLMYPKVFIDYAQAQREIALTIGEPPATRGYPPSVFARLPQLVERAGNGAAGRGSITAFYTVLTEGDDQQEPIADAARAILDGHIVLSRKLAQQNHFPAIDVLASASRVMGSVTSPEHRDWAGQIKEWMAIYKQAEDIINIGAYAKGSNPKIDQAIGVHDRITSYLRQKIDDPSTLADSMGMIHSICRSGEAMIKK
jgi:hypothetical protein